MGILVGLSLSISFIACCHNADAAGWKAGTARVVITPRQPMWMAGYGARNRPSEGVLHELWAKALAVEDPTGQKAVVITLDLCGIDGGLSNQIRDDLKSRHGLDRAHVVLACSHTHTGPVVGRNLITMYPLDEEQTRLVAEYTNWLHQAVVEVAGKAIEMLVPAELAWETGRADFAVNRRENKEPDVPELREQIALKGPSDHDVPVLRIRGADGSLKAIVCGHACHCTVLDLYQLTGDYAGFAQIALEKAHPGAQAMFVAGCGADQNPLPRRTVALAEAYGNQLAQSVERVLAEPMRPVEGSLTAAYEEIDLAFGPLPSREQVETDAASKTFAVASRARLLLKTLEREGKLPETYPYPVQVWRLGDDLTWIFLGGEVVVDYSLRLKRNLGSSHTWVSSYCNDVMAYIPSVRILKEGGYEGATAMIYYGQPTSWSERVEDQIIGSVRKLEQATRRP
jgi:hypothetical protein